MSENAGGAPDRENDTQVPPRVARGGKLTEIRLAAGFLTILPLLPRAAVAPETLAASFGWFPLVGFALGALLAAGNLVLTPLFGDALAAVLLVLTLTVLTGAVHVDALADTADALGAGSNRRRALEIMRDSRIGSFGTAAIFFFFALEIVALMTMGEARRTVALCLAPGLARWAMVAVGWRIDYLRAEGAGTLRRSQSRAGRRARGDRCAAHPVVASAVGLCRGRGACGRAARGVPAMARRCDGRSSWRGR
jgi:adenosylcobinamide-GDP ribazoletransferase